VGAEATKPARDAPPAGGIEIVQVRQQISKRIADFAILVAELLNCFRRGGDVSLIIHRAAPQPQQVGAVAVDLIDGLHIFLVRLRNLRAIGFHHETVRENARVRSASHRAERRQKRKLEPSAVLVGAFEIKIGGTLEPARVEHGMP
jgi:hypothetical protein